MGSGIINNLRYVMEYDERPPYVEEYDTILGYAVYHSTFNELIYVIYDHLNKKYRSLENQGSKNIHNDLETYIRFVFTTLP